MSSSENGYDWINDESAFPTCISFVTGTTLNEVLLRLRCEDLGNQALDFGEAERLQDFDAERYVIQVQEDPMAVVLIEPNGFLGSMPQVAKLLSRNSGRVVSAFWNIEGVMRFTVADDGVLVRSFDPIIYEIDFPGHRGVPLEEERNLRFGDPETAGISMLALFEAVTAYRVSFNEIYNRRRPTFRVALSLLNLEE